MSSYSFFGNNVGPVHKTIFPHTPPKNQTAAWPENQPSGIPEIPDLEAPPNYLPDRIIIHRS